MNDNKNNKQTNYDVAEINGYGKRPQFSLEPNDSTIINQSRLFGNQNGNNNVKGSEKK